MPEGRGFRGEIAMTVNFEKMRQDLANSQKQLDFERRRFTILAIGVASACVAAGAALATLLLHLLGKI